ncbi:hypothetical protein GOODEAATRI_023376, partial [Goodea atripinnis]
TLQSGAGIGLATEPDTGPDLCSGVSASDDDAVSRLTCNGNALAAMQDTPKFGLGHMPPVETAIASLIVAPDEALGVVLGVLVLNVALRTICYAKLMILVPDWDGLAILYLTFCWVCLPHLRVL